MDLDWERIETWAKGWVETLELDWFTPFRLSWTLSKPPAVFLWRAAYTSTSALFQVARVPALILLRIILVFFSPIIFIVQYSLVPFWFALDILISLEPLYIFFGCAALVGVIAGTTLSYTSSIFGSLCGLDDDTGSPIKLLKTEPVKYNNSSASSWARLEKTWQDSAPKPKPRKRRTRGLFPQTIVEEDDDL